MSPFGNLVIAFIIILSYLFLGSKSYLLIYFLCFLSIFITLCSYSERVKSNFLEFENLIEVNLENNCQLIFMIESISEARNIYLPKIFINKSLLPEDFVSLYTIGRCRFRISKSLEAPKYSGILIIHEHVIDILDESELFHVIGHEMSHLVFWDSLRSATASVLSILLSTVSCLIILKIETVSPSFWGVAALLIVVIFSFSWQRKFFFDLEFAADRNALWLVAEAEKIYEVKINNKQI